MKGNNFIAYTKFEMASVDDGLLSVENSVMKLLGVLQKRWVRIQFCSASVRAVRLSFKGLFIIHRGLELPSSWLDPPNQESCLI